MRDDQRDPGDAGLLAQVARGDRRAFESLYHSYLPRLTRFLARRLARPHVIEEVADDTMLAVWRNAATWDQSCMVSTWIFAIAWHKARTAAARHTALDALESGPDQLEAGPDSQPDHRLALLRQQQSLATALRQLPAAQRAVVQLTYFHDMHYAEIADVLGCPQNTVKSRMAHARRRLALLLADRHELH